MWGAGKGHAKRRGERRCAHRAPRLRGRGRKRAAAAAALLLCSQVAAAGMVVNTLGWVEGLGYELLLHVVKALRVRV